jgi:beta-lactamase regulating signal transducer with metallopeptidase domain
MADFLLLLGRLNLAVGAAIIAVYLLRRPLRTQFGAPIAYAIWLLVPMAGIASVMPPGVVPPAAHFIPVHYAAAPIAALGQIAHPALRITERLVGQSALAHPVMAVRTLASGYGTADTAMLFFAAWALGAMAMALHLARLQARFHAAVQLGVAGPAVLGMLRPRIVMPDAFQEHFTAAEQAAVLAHEQVHLARQDARINALAALLRCLCWFNPLVHFGVASLRIDQELACDATAVAGPVSRRDYANALLKSHVMVTALPLGCNWPESQHPLVERVALLKRKPPNTARRVVGTAFVVLAATFAGLGVWAAQPSAPAEFVAGAHGNQIVPAKAMTLAMMSGPALGQIAGDTGLREPAAEATAIGHPVERTKDVKAGKRNYATLPAGKQPSDTAVVNQAPPELLPASVQVPDRIEAGISAPPLNLDGALAMNVAAEAARAQATTADAVPAPYANAARRKSEALACLLGMIPDGCEAFFKKAWQSRAYGSITYCTQKYLHWKDGCRFGPLESVAFLGTDADGADVYDVSFQHADTTYIVFSPASDGKIPAFVIFKGPHGAIFSSLARITSPANQLLYTRPNQQG